MRKIYSILLAAFALSAVSCQEEIVDPTVEVPVKEVMTITAGFDTETKTVLHTNGVSSLWHENDKVSVFDTKVGNNNRCFSIVKEEGDEFPKATATFATAEEFTMPGDQTQDQALIVALYPYQETAYCDFFDPQDGVNDITGITIPVEQVAVADGFDASATFALATGKYTERDNLRFKNLYSLLKINVLEEGVKKIEVVLETEGFIAGEAQIVLTPGVDENERPVFNGGVLTATGSKSVTLTCEAGFEVGKIYSVAIAPVTYTNVKVYLDDQLAKDTTPATAKTLEPNTFYNIRDLKKLATRGLAFDEATYNVLLGNDFIAPELKGEKEGVVYTSSNEEVATVDAATGAVTVLAEGETVITASAPQTTALLAGEASYTLVVGEKAARNLAFSDETASATIGVEFTAPTLSGEKTGVVYSSSNKEVATVDAATGDVTIVAVGETTITAAAEENETHLEGSASYVLTVSPAPKVERGLAFNPTSVTLTYGETFTAPVLSGVADGVKYTSSEPTVATVTSEGVVEILKAGTTTITASAEETETLLAGEATYTLTVNKADRTVSFTQSSVEVTYGDPFTGQTLVDVTGVTYTVTSGDAATVNATTGAVVIVKAGTVTIKATVAATATHNECDAEYTLTVKKAKRANAVGFSKSSDEVTYGTDATYTEPELTNLLEGDVVSYAVTEGTDVVEVVATSGNITTKKAGTATIKATITSDKYEDVTASYTLTVKKVLYLVPNANWKQASARFAAYFFGAGEKWVDMTDDNSDGIYEVIVPDGGYTTVIFCRMDPGKSENSWTTKWSQTGDMTIGDKLYCVIPELIWEGSTIWSDDTSLPFIKSNEYYLVPNDDWKKDNAVFAAYFCNGTSSAKWVGMEAVDGAPGYFKVAKPSGENHKNIIFVRMKSANYDWSNKHNQTSDLTFDSGNVYEITGWDNSGKWHKLK